MNDDKGFGKLELALGVCGILPIPIVGELCLAGLFYRTLQNVSLFRENKIATFGVSLVSSCLVRNQLYGNFYRQLAHYLIK